MISDQILDKTMGSQSWVVSPVENRLFVFNAKYLHGVMPGVGVTPTGKVEDRRLTFMVGFWRSIEAKDKGKDCVGAGQPYPLMKRVEPPKYPTNVLIEEEQDDSDNNEENVITRFTWPSLLQPKEEWRINEGSASSSSSQSEWKLNDLVELGVTRIAPLWKAVHANTLNEQSMQPGLAEDYQSFYQGF